MRATLSYLTIDAVSQLDKNHLHTYLCIVPDHNENETVSIADICGYFRLFTFLETGDYAVDYYRKN